MPMTMSMCYRFVKNAQRNFLYGCRCVKIADSNPFEGNCRNKVSQVQFNHVNLQSLHDQWISIVNERSG